MSAKSTAAPRPSASLVVINARNEVLLVHRNPKASSFAGAHVFPGGNFDGKQDSSSRMTAIRETFEESGLLFASPAESIPDAVTMATARQEIHSMKRTFGSFLEEHGLKTDESVLMPFTQWLTPVEAPRRYHTHFYVAFLPSSHATGFSAGAKEEQMPTPDGGQEVISARFLTPSAWLSLFREQKITFMPPQYYILSTLADIPPASLREGVLKLSNGAFGKMSVHPERLFTDGKKVTFTYEGDEERGGQSGRRHRVNCEVGKGGVMTRIDLEQSFDVFSQIEHQVPAESSKL
ncbi:hypothetical protein CYLTODRAFT_423532 [Cylindrobasidium torrendii FP15055 ss-10]|uniref:Nudix hydrolase domain-containing protein n=1 Tax=Cylindrobasidium torrendii FP15055 ss-10 TaxID=1314674 RepID=A0A0D7B9X1_9AGAR|nr:hypothetical protein CYLTODRAFT_423532 [Cylindrobasidium torrendii FP15055 ss-10]